MPRYLLIMLFSISPLLAQQFTKVTSGPVVSDGGDSRAVNWIDYDNDGDLDLFITNGPSAGQNNFFYENDKGTFIKVENIAITLDGSPSDGSTWGDFNNDGYSDLFVANWYGKNNKLYLNNGNKTFTELTDTASNSGGHSESASWSDYNKDGFLDLFVANSSGSLENFMYRNSTSERFTRISGIAITDDKRASRHMDWVDYDNDGYTDLFVANEDNQKNFLYHNNGDSTFTRINTGDIVNDNGASFGSSWADYDNDGDWDLFVANWNNQNNALYRNNGDGTFEKLSDLNIVSNGGYSIGTAWGDVDNDGDTDLFVANGFSNDQTDNFLYFNNGDGTFTRDTSVVSRDGGWSYGASFGDYNRDGFLDLAVAKCYGAIEDNALFINNGNTNNWVTLKLKGTVSNKSAIGSVIRIKSKINGKDTWQMRQISGQGGYCGQNLEVHFGLGDAVQIDSLIINWPSGQIGKFIDLPVNQLKEIEESVPGGYLRPHFKANTRVGFGKEQLFFSDLSVTEDDNPVTLWQWDFDNNGTTDSEEKNPAWSYDSLGRYSVKLIVTNGSETKSKVFKNYISIQRVPGIPIINSYYPSPADTTILKGEQLAFYAQATDTSAYALEYAWYLNDQLKSKDSVYNYRASAFNVPRTDSVKLLISNGYNSTQLLWQIYVVNDITDLQEQQSKNLSYRLFDNYPNPFNAATTIKYTIADNQLVNIGIYDVSGRYIETIHQRHQSPGHYTITYNARQLASGIYYVHLQAGDFTDVKKIVLIK